MMRKILFVLLASIITLTACQPTAESYIGELKALIEKVVEEGSDYTADQWEEVGDEFEELIKKAEDLDGLTDEQKKEIKKLQGKFNGVMMKGGFDKFLDDAGDELEKASEAIKGFLEGMSEED